MTEAGDWQGKEIDLGDIARLYQDLSGEWLLFEVLEERENGSPQKLRIHGHHASKDALREMMLEQDDWNWKQRFLIVKANPDKCELE